MSKAKKTQDKPSPLQRFIRRRADTMGLSRYEIARRCGWKPADIYPKLRRPTLHTSLERMLAALHARVTIRGVTVKMGLNRDGEVQAVKVVQPTSE